MNTFRPLNENERRAIDSAYIKGKIPFDPLASGIESLKVSYEKMQGGFCVCVIKIEIARDLSGLPHLIIFRGASRRSYKDKRNEVRGEMLAFSRAILYSRPVELS